MARNRLTLALACCCLLLSLSGCMPSVVQTSHEYVLARTEGGQLLIVEDDDPLYQQFDDWVFSDPYRRRLLDVFEHTTEAFLATNTPTSLPQTMANRLIVVVDSDQAGVLREITLHHDGHRVPIELAIGVGREGSVDLDHARRILPRVMAPLLLELVGLEPEPAPASASPALHEPTTPSQAFWLGFQEALVSLGAQQPQESASSLLPQETINPGAGERPQCVPQAPSLKGAQPPASARSFEGASRTPGLVATFLCRLLQQAGSFYPQRHMLWFASFDPEEIPYSKLLLAVSRMPSHQGISVQGFIEAYIETFPAEKTPVRTLAREIFGSPE